MEVEFTKSPKNEDIDILINGINEETPKFGGSHPFAFYIRDKEDNIIAGCNGFVSYGAIYTDQLWVHKDYRNKGLGKLLLEKAEAYAKQEGCTLSTLVTMDFQNKRAFYEKLGYTCDLERPGYSNNNYKCLFFKKAL